MCERRAKCRGRGTACKPPYGQLCCALPARFAAVSRNRNLREVFGWGPSAMVQELCADQALRLLNSPGAPTGNTLTNEISCACFLHCCCRLCAWTWDTAVSAVLAFCTATSVQAQGWEALGPGIPGAPWDAVYVWRSCGSIPPHPQRCTSCHDVLRSPKTRPKYSIPGSNRCRQVWQRVLPVSR